MAQISNNLSLDMGFQGKKTYLQAVSRGLRPQTNHHLAEIRSDSVRPTPPTVSPTEPNRFAPRIVSAEAPPVRGARAKTTQTTQKTSDADGNS